MAHQQQTTRSQSLSTKDGEAYKSAIRGSQPSTTFQARFNHYSSHTITYHGRAYLLAAIELEEVLGGGVKHRVLGADQRLDAVAQPGQLSRHELKRVRPARRWPGDTSYSGRPERRGEVAWGVVGWMVGVMLKDTP